ncbi:hypothetical protein CLU79DRAFT_772564 [Phycomyces nitens]|nr:hypothetical protein CLU79DRAFT_772564 [Phycomyces nitens]
MADKPLSNQDAIEPNPKRPRINNSNDDDDDDSKKRESDNVLNILGSSVQGMQSAFTTIASSFTNSIQTTLAINQSMNEFYEQMFAANIKIGSKLEPFEDQNGSGIQLTITITNNNRYPISALLELSFEPLDKTGATVAWTSKSAFKTIIGSQDKKDADSMLGSKQDLNMPSTTIYVETLQVYPSEICQYNSKLVAMVPSPGTGKLIKLEHKFGLYLIDQMTKTVQESGSNEDKLGSEKEYRTQFLRQIMGLHPVIGMGLGMEIRLKTKQKEVFCRIIGFSDDLETVKTVFYGDCQLRDRLLSELDILSI